MERGKWQHASSAKKVFIVGWYGTETVGDKAILGGIMAAYRQNYPDVQFWVGSLNPFVTRRTLYELREAASVIPVPSLRFLRCALASDIVVMGGGPLMDISTLYVPLWAFLLARLRKRERVIYGCGLGPLKQQRYIDATRQILNMATRILVRDSASKERVQRISGRSDVVVSGDPARPYIEAIQTAQVGTVLVRPVVACFLREWPRLYAQELNDQQFQETNERFEAHLAQVLRRLYIEQGLTPVFYAMADIPVAKDDRVYARQFSDRYLKDIPVEIQNTPSSIKLIVDGMRQAQVCLCMRFHSVLFAGTLGRPFVAIDYTGGGKIKGFLSDEGKINHYITIKKIAQDPAEFYDVVMKQRREH